MALIKCPECGKEISDKASSCPNCGCPVVLMHEDKTQNIEEQILPEEEQILKEATVQNSRHAKIAAALMIVSAIVFVAFLIPLCVTDDFFVPGIIVVTCSSMMFLISFVFYLIRNRKVSYSLELHNNMRLFAFGIGLKPTLYVDGEKYQIITMNYGEDADKEYLAVLPNNEKVNIYFKRGQIFLAHQAPTVATSGNTIINNIYQKPSKTGKTERSDMEKILIKNAKIDALASIDPTNTEKSKEQINIVKELDDLE